MDKVSIPEYINYTVKSGDTIYSISKKYNISVDQLLKDNALSSPTVWVGMNLKIRTKEEDLEECFGREFDGMIPSNYTTYTVKVGDSLYKIAKNYNTSVSEILNLNQLNSSSLQIGQVLKIPTQDLLYTVVKGDSLYSISKKFQTSVDSIKNKNGLKSNTLQIGQVLKIQGVL